MPDERTPNGAARRSTAIRDAASGHQRNSLHGPQSFGHRGVPRGGDNDGHPRRLSAGDSKSDSPNLQGAVAARYDIRN
jgi:hypothetical protein